MSLIMQITTTVGKINTVMELRHKQTEVTIAVCFSKNGEKHGIINNVCTERNN